MKHTLCMLLFIIVLQVCNGQTDSTKIFNAKALKKGFYKSYSEFINNAPSIVKDFILTSLVKSKADTTVIGGRYSISDSIKAPIGVWGFCDGTDVYVTPTNSIYIKKKFWKLASLGPYPYFTIAVKEIIVFSPFLGFEALSVAASAAAPTKYDMMVIDEKGRFKQPTIGLMKKWMKSQPDLLKAFTEEAKKYEIYDDPTEFRPDDSIESEKNTIKEYLIKLNIALKNK